MKRAREASQPSQRGIGAFLTGANAEKYTEAKLPKRGRPSLKATAAVVSGVPSKAAASSDGITNGPSQQLDAAVPDAVIQMDAEPQPSQTRVLSSGGQHYGSDDDDPEVQSDDASSVSTLDSDSDDDDEPGSDEDEDPGSSDDSDEDSGLDPSNRNQPASTSQPTPKAAAPRKQGQRIRKGQSDGDWRLQQSAYRFQQAWAAAHFWAACVPADAEAGEIHDRVRCTICSLARKVDVLLEARSQTLKAHAASKGHRKAEARQQQLAAKAELNKLTGKGQQDLQAAWKKNRSKSDRGVLQQLIQLFFLLDHGRPITDFASSKAVFKRLRVPDFREHNFTVYSGWQYAEALDAVVCKRIRELVAGARFISVSLDESTGVDKKSRLSVHVYIMEGWSRVPLFVELAALRQADADSIVEALLDILEVQAGIPAADLSRKLVAVSTDGASVMTGVHTGVATQLTQIAPHLVSIHCMAHRSDLAVGALEAAPIIKAIVSLLNTIFNYFTHSAKRVAALEETAEEAGTQGNRILKNVETRWISMHRPLTRTLDVYPTLLVFFADEDGTIYMQLTDAQSYMAMKAVLPGIIKVNIFIKCCQLRGVFIGELASQLRQLQADLRAMYLDPATRYKSHHFEAYKKLVPTNSDLTGTCWVESAEDNEIGLEMGGSFHAFHAVPPRTGRGGRPCTLPVSLTPELLQQVASSVEVALTAAMQMLVDDLYARFPPHTVLDACSIVYYDYWASRTPPTYTEFKVKLGVIKAHYGKECTGPEGEPVPPKLSSEQLDIQAALFYETMVRLAKAERARQSRQATARARQEALQAAVAAGTSSKVVKRKLREAEEETPTVRLWEQITNSPAIAASLTEFVALAELVFVMVPGSVEDERRFSAMSFIQDTTRNRLDEHLALCVRMFTQELFDLDTFPFEAALAEWKGASEKGRYRMNR